MEFTRQEFWSGFLFPYPGDLLDPGIEPWSPALQPDSLPSESPGTTCINMNNHNIILFFQKGKITFKSKSLFT